MYENRYNLILFRAYSLKIMECNLALLILQCLSIFDIKIETCKGGVILANLQGEMDIALSSFSEGSKISICQKHDETLKVNITATFTANTT